MFSKRSCLSVFLVHILLTSTTECVILKKFEVVDFTYCSSFELQVIEIRTSLSFCSLSCVSLDICVGFSFNKLTEECKILNYKRQNATFSGARDNNDEICYADLDVYRCSLKGNDTKIVVPDLSLMRLSTTYGTDHPEHCYDGLLSTYCQTKDEYKPWFGIDLGRMHTIVGVKVTNSNTTYPDRLHNFEVRTGWQWPTNDSDDVAFDLLCNSHDGAGIDRLETVDLICTPHPVFGRFVFLQIISHCLTCTQKTSNWLLVSEIEVFGCPNHCTV